MQFRATHFMSLQNALYSIPSVQHTICHCERKNGVPAGYCVPVGKRHTQAKEWALSPPIMRFQKCSVRRISRKGYHIKPHARYFCTCVEKKAQTSKRVSVIACDNVISKAQFAPCSAMLLMQRCTFGAMSLRQWYCLRSDIVFDSDIALQWYLPCGQVKDKSP